MTDAELLTECKTGLGIQVDSTAFDSVLTQKLLAVKSFMHNAGVTDDAMGNDMAVGVIVMGVTDLWKIEGGEIKFSPAFYTLISQLAIGGNILTVSSNPADGAIGVAVNTEPVLTFNKRITAYTISLVNYSTKDSITVTAELDITGKILTITPNSNLDAATKYAIVIKSVIAYSGQKLDYTVISFTTS